MGIQTIFQKFYMIDYDIISHLCDVRSGNSYVFLSHSWRSRGGLRGSDMTDTFIWNIPGICPRDPFIPNQSKSIGRFPKLWGYPWLSSHVALISHGTHLKKRSSYWGLSIWAVFKSLSNSIESWFVYRDPLLDYEITPNMKGSMIRPWTNHQPTEV